jgi:stage V sporulation protein R
MGLAYEIVINSNPCIAYLMEENTHDHAGLVIAHAAYGHNSFFKGNYLFRTWTNADAIIDYLVFARNYITECEERHGEKRSSCCSTPATP